MLLVLTFHFQAEFSKYYPQYYGFPFSDYMFNGVYLGAIGVSLFFILSGAALMISPKADAPGVYYKKNASLPSIPLSGLRGLPHGFFALHFWICGRIFQAFRVGRSFFPCWEWMVILFRRFRIIISLASGFLAV